MHELYCVVDCLAGVAVGVITAVQGIDRHGYLGIDDTAEAKRGKRTDPKQRIGGSAVSSSERDANVGTVLGLLVAKHRHKVERSGDNNEQEGLAINHTIWNKNIRTRCV